MSKERQPLADRLCKPELPPSRPGRARALDGVGSALFLLFALTGIAHRLPGQVNPAFQQRAALARAMALAPEVLLLDNPFAALNTGHMRWWLDFLTRPAGEAKAPGAPPATVVVVCDDLRPWLPAARQFALLQDGGWQVLGGREELTAARGPLLRELLAESAPNR